MQQLPASAVVNRIGKYLYEHVDGAYKFQKDRNTYDLYVEFQYQDMPKYTESPPINTMIINISLTTYQNKIRVNIIEVSPQSRTLGYDLFKPELLDNLQVAQNEILKRVKSRVYKAYPDTIITI